jgi:hypothetical protein
MLVTSFGCLTLFTYAIMVSLSCMDPSMSCMSSNSVMRACISFLLTPFWCEACSVCVCTCNSPYWNTRAKGKSEKKLLPLKFNGEEVLDSNFKRYTARKDIGTKIYR